MPEHLRALIVIVFLAGTVFAFARQPAAAFTSMRDFSRRRNLWLVLTLFAFLAHDFWLFALIAGPMLLFLGQREPNRLALFFFLLFLIPPVSAEIPGLGLINYLFALSYPRILAFALLLPAALLLQGRKNITSVGSTWPDRLLLLYLFVVVLFQLRETSMTDTLRQALYAFTDVWLPYYVASRSLRNLADFKGALFAFALAAMVLAIIGVFEMTRHWLLYSGLIKVFGLSSGLSNYLERADLLRANASTGHPIALGYAITVAIGFYFFLSESIRSHLYRRLGGLLLVAGLIAPISRGPWVGAAALVATFVLTGRTGAKRLAILAVAGIVALPLLAVVPGGEKVINLLPFIGNIEKYNIDYRERLIDNALIVIERNPWFGSANYLGTPEMQSMLQGQGIIDVVNTYIGVALKHGLVGLGLFVGFFALILLGIRKALRSLADKDDEMYQLGRALLATLVGILVIIATVSSISIIPIVYWSVAGLGVAYARLVREHVKAERVEAAA